MVMRKRGHDTIRYDFNRRTLITGTVQLPLANLFFIIIKIQLYELVRATSSFQPKFQHPIKNKNNNIIIDKNNVRVLSKSPLLSTSAEFTIQISIEMTFR